jgi:hypothetical protein
VIGLPSEDRSAEGRSVPEPFAINAFREWHGVATLAEAAQRVAARALARLPGGGGTHINPLVSVTQLCDVLGIVLEGVAPTMSRAGREIEKVDCARYRSEERARLSFHDGKAVVRVSERDARSLARARYSVAHEVGHFLIHQRGDTMDWMTLRADTTVEEEALAEYIGRLLLLPKDHVDAFIKLPVTALQCVTLAARAEVSLHAAAARLLDVDATDRGIRGVIFWQMAGRVDSAADIAKAFAPHWHQCPGSFVPVRRCHLRHDSMLARLAHGTGKAQDAAQEEVSIGSFKGRFKVSGFAWGSVEKRSRKALSVFTDPEFD